MVGRLGADWVTLSAFKMEPVRVIYRHEPPHGWWAESPDVEGWITAAESFDEARRLAEEGVRFALDRGDVQIEHFVPERSLPARVAPA